MPAGGCSKKSPLPAIIYTPLVDFFKHPSAKSPLGFSQPGGKTCPPLANIPVDFFNAPPLSTPPVDCFKHPPHPANSPPISAPSLFIFSKAYTHYSVVFCAFKKSLLVKTNFASKYRGISPKASFAKNISLQLYT